MVVTRLTRNQLTGNRPGVRIPPSPPNKKSRRQAGFFICIGFEVYPRKGKSLHLRQKALEIQCFQGFSFFLNGSGICLILKMVPMVPGFVVPRQFGLCTKNECCGAGMVPIAPAASYKSEYKHKDALNDLRERPSAYSMLITEFKSKSFWW